MGYTTASDGARLHWETHGSGDPVLLIMGLGSNAYGWHRPAVRGYRTGMKKVRRDAVPPFRRLVYRVVARVPRGKVVTYGQVAAILGQPRAARAVGTALAALGGAYLNTVPWQRVI